MLMRLLIFIITIGLSLFIYSIPVSVAQTKVNIKNFEKPTLDQIYFHTLCFSEEQFPAHDAVMRSKMKKMLATYHCRNLQTTKLHDKARQWFPIIEPILKQYGIPEDFKYMPLVESGLKSGTSPKGAAGPWQFMPQTGRDFGLRVNSQVDERSDIKKSTIAACKYLKYLYSEFNSWTLAAAAYNGGEGSIRRAITQKNNGDYFRMNLKHETATHVYRLIAMKEIIENPHLYGYRRVVMSSL